MLDFRAASAIVVIGLCALAIFRGWSMVQFSQARAFLAPDKHAADRFASFAVVPGLASAALEASATPVDGPSDQAGALKRIDELTTVLALRPMSSMNWLSLASMRRITGQPPDKVLSALGMSSLTGQNEHAIMYQRGIFGLLEWEALPEDFRKQTIRDLSGVMLSGNWGDNHRRAVVEALAPKSKETRSYIGDLLRGAGVAVSELALMQLALPPAICGHEQGRC
jgi:hypothetical protein